MRVRRTGLATVVVMAGVLVSGGRAGATVVQGLDLAGKVDAAAIVVHGVVENVQAEWDLTGTRIRTMVTLVVKTSLKGDVQIGRRILVERGGGTVDGVTQKAAGLSRYALGEEVILFLEPLGAHFVAIGIGIGKYDVRLEPSGEKIVHHAPEVHALRYVQGRPIVAPIAPMNPEPMDTFFKRVRTLVRRPAGASTVKGRTGFQRRPPLRLPGNR